MKDVFILFSSLKFMDMLKASKLFFKVNSSAEALFFEFVA